jgi:hypothetical protein
MLNSLLVLCLFSIIKVALADLACNYGNLVNSRFHGLAASGNATYAINGACASNSTTGIPAIGNFSIRSSADYTLEATCTSFQMFHIEGEWVQAPAKYQITECEGMKVAFLE